VTALFRPEDELEELRSAILERTGSPSCHLLTSARAALSLVLLGLKRLSDRPQVIVPAYTCPTVPQSVLTAGLEPVFCDVAPETLDLDRSALSRLLDRQGAQVLAIVPAHLYGLAQDVGDLLAIGRQAGIVVIEDAAQAFGAAFAGRMVGTRGEVGLYSLGRGKCIPAGHGGVLVAGDERVAAAVDEVLHEVIAAGDGSSRLPADLKALALFGAYGLATRPLGWWFVARTPLNPAEEGMDWSTLPPIHLRRLSPVQAGLGVSILKRLDRLQSVSRQNARRLMAQVAEFDFVGLPHLLPEAEPVFLRLPIVVDSEERANRLFDRLWQEGIGVSRSYLRTLPDLTGFGNLSGPAAQREFPGASRLAACLLTLPTHAYLREGDFAAVRRAFQAVHS
jgi:dTDP-4-amino-4,6-dideoxygalactose transaminase